LLGVTASATSNKSVWIVTGVCTAGGIQMATGNATGKAVFAGGTFKTSSHDVHIRQTFNSRTCLITATARGRYTLSGGTAKYAGISGSGKFVTSVLGAATRSGSEYKS
jgi:hypothetical protein